MEDIYKNINNEHAHDPLSFLNCENKLNNEHILVNRLCIQTLMQLWGKHNKRNVFYSKTAASNK